MKHLFKTTVYILIFIFSYSQLSSQELLQEIPLEKQVKNATSIIEGKVIAKKSYWDSDYNLIYTVNTLEVTKIFKGKTVSKVNVITMGGTVNESSSIVNPSLSLNYNDVGLITLQESDIKLVDYNTSNGILYKPYCTVQSFYKYNTFNNEVINTFQTIPNISDFNLQVEKLTGITSKKTDLANKSNNLTKVTSSKAVLAPSNINFSPSSIGAGSQSQLTITGNGFGNSTGVVFFRDPDNGGRGFASALDSDIISWTDTRIVMQVPARAGTGTIVIRNSAGQETQSTNSLFIPFSLTNLGRRPAQHFDLNGNGGLTWRINFEIAGDKQVNDAVLRAIDTWRCETGISWEIGPNTNVNSSINDGINAISFGDLPAGTLGITFVKGSTCDGRVFLINDVDVIMRRPNTVNWNFGPGPTARFSTDFETTFLHELGHAHLLGHVINSSDLMNFSITSGRDTRTLGSANITGADIIMDNSTTRRVCRNQNLLQTFVCPTNSLTDEILNNTITPIRVFPNPNKGVFFIEAEANLNLEKAVIFDVSGRLIKEIDLTGVTNTTTVDLSGASSGLYFVNIYYNNTKEVKKVLVE